MEVTMDEPVVEIHFPGVSPAQAGVYAQELEQYIRSADSDSVLKIERKREDPESQSLGALLLVVLPHALPHVPTVALALVEGIRAWQEWKGSSGGPRPDFEVKTPDGKTTPGDQVTQETIADGISGR
jgi:hypothetical protein